MAIAFGGCGSGSDGTADSPSREEVREGAAVVNALAGGEQTVEEGTLKGPGGKAVPSTGPADDNREAVAVLRRMQRDFDDGEVGAVCKRVDSFMLSQFHPGGTTRDSSCPVKLEAFSQVLDRRGRAPGAIKLLSVRSYGWEASVWVENSAGKRIRIPFTNDTRKTGWKLQLGSFGNPEVLAAKLVDR